MLANPRQRALKIHQTLLAAFGEPIWRDPLPAIDELVSTILSQNTNDVNRDKAFHALRAKFPAWEEVRDAPAAAVIEAIRVAGLANQKARGCSRYCEKSPPNAAAWIYPSWPVGRSKKPGTG